MTSSCVFVVCDVIVDRLSAMSSNPAIDFDTKIVANTLSVAFLTEYVPESSQVMDYDSLLFFVSIFL